MSKHLILVGGGHAHMTVMLNLRDYIERGHRVTLVGPSPYHYYSGMGPGMLSGIYRSQDVRFHVKKMVEDRGASFIQDTVTRIDPARKVLILHSGTEIEYDVVSFNTGSHVPMDSNVVSNNTIFPVKPVVNLLKARQAILDLVNKATPRLAVIGGGPAALEVAGNLWRLVHNTGAAASITVLGGRNFLALFPQKAQRYARKSLASRNIEILEGHNVSRLANGRAILEDGREFPFDLALLAWGIQPSNLFRESDLPAGEDGGLLVNAYLQSVAYPDVFGGGDCISFESRSLDKVGVYAVRQNPVLHHNLLAALEDGSLQAFQPQETYLLIFNLGNGTGIFYRRNRVWKGKLVFYLKDYIDRKFMKKFQVSGESREPENIE
jgi:NADH dehydrogenase FAD-containing subunit